MSSGPSDNSAKSNIEFSELLVTQSSTAHSSPLPGTFSISNTGSQSTQYGAHFGQQEHMQSSSNTTSPLDSCGVYPTNETQRDNCRSNSWPAQSRYQIHQNLQQALPTSVMSSDTISLQNLSNPDRQNQRVHYNEIHVPQSHLTQLQAFACRMPIGTQQMSQTPAHSTIPAKKKVTKRKRSSTQTQQSHTDHEFYGGKAKSSTLDEETPVDFSIQSKKRTSTIPQLPVAKPGAQKHLNLPIQNQKFDSLFPQESQSKTSQMLEISEYKQKEQWSGPTTQIPSESHGFKERTKVMLLLPSQNQVDMAFAQKSLRKNQTKVTQAGDLNVLQLEQLTSYSGQPVMNSLTRPILPASAIHTTMQAEGAQQMNESGIRQATISKKKKIPAAAGLSSSTSQLLGTSKNTKATRKPKKKSATNPILVTLPDPCPCSYDEKSQVVEAAHLSEIISMCYFCKKYFCPYGDRKHFTPTGNLEHLYMHIQRYHLAIPGVTDLLKVLFSKLINP